ncbi:hypothetical protein B0189_06275 [Moraxella cuniculi]|nr:hypothetical protein B0189_06275 [Moraxella cuniculi]
MAILPKNTEKSPQMAIFAEFLHKIGKILPMCKFLFGLIVCFALKLAIFWPFDHVDSAVLLT